MKNLLLGSTIALTGFTMPLIADYCCPVPCEPSCCVADFNGFYFGGNVGVYSNTAHRNDYDGFFATGGTRTTNTTNVTAGLQVGYDWDCCNKLLGVVADWNWVNNRSNNRSSTTMELARDRFDWFTTIRARAGITVCDALTYVTLGAAVFSHDFRGTTILSTHRHSITRWGWAGGVGTEFALGCNWSLGAEILVLNFSNRNKTFTDSATGTQFTFGFSDTAYLGRIILNYRFGDLFCL